jgi:3-phosphoshikimate 1-carboxyvinyltransferase
MMNSNPVVPLEVSPGSKLRGVVRAPGDKSISHRALIVAALATGRSRLTGLLMSDDVRRTVDALTKFGIRVTDSGRDSVFVDGTGISGFMEPSGPIDLGNSGTAARLLMGVAAGNPIRAVFVGDESLSTRPMGRVIAPLRQMGAKISVTGNGGLPAIIQGADPLLPMSYRLPVASAQVKSAVLLAGLHAPGTTSVIEATETRDHTEKLLKNFGADVRIESTGSERRISVIGQPELLAQEVSIVGDPSSAAFPLVAGLVTGGSEVCVEGVGVNKTRTGLFDCLRQMGADLEIISRGIVCGEPIADITARSSRLKGIVVPADRVPRMVDEYPILAVAAARAEGETVMHGLGELRVKESNRFASIVEGLVNCGVKVQVLEDTITIAGNKDIEASHQPAEIRTFGDHRMAMAFTVMGLASKKALIIDDMSMVVTSYPEFKRDMVALGAAI